MARGANKEGYALLINIIIAESVKDGCHAGRFREIIYIQKVLQRQAYSFYEITQDEKTQLYKSLWN